MGLLDALAGQVLGSLSQAGDERHDSLIEAIGGMLGDSRGGGGFGALVQAFEKQGLGDVVASWISTGRNLPISAEQLQSVLGNDQLASIARSSGFSPQEASGHLSELLPQVIDRLTPNGQAPAGGSLASILGMLDGMKR